MEADTKKYLVLLSPNHYRLIDHAGGFDSQYRNHSLESIKEQKCIVFTEYEHLSHDSVYKNIKFVFDFKIKKSLLEKLNHYNVHPEINYKNFICSFNGTAHVSRKFLTAILHRYGWFDTRYSTKIFVCRQDELDGHIHDYCDHDQSRFYRKFFISDTSEDFLQMANSFHYDRTNHNRSIEILATKLTQSFLHVVSESMATNYKPIVTEKFLYSIVTRGLFLAYAQPGWHHNLEHYYGFKKYNKIFDYQFDSLINPVHRLVQMMSMISKFSYLSDLDRSDLYLMEKDTIEYNYDHYFSNRYLSHLKTCYDDGLIAC